MPGPVLGPYRYKYETVDAIEVHYLETYVIECPKTFDTWVDVENTKQSSTPMLSLQSTKRFFSFLSESKVLLQKSSPLQGGDPSGLQH